MYLIKKLEATILIGIVTLTVLPSKIIGSDVYHAKYNWAMSFMIEEYFTLGPHEGYGLSLSRKITNTGWIRMSESFSIDNYDQSHSDVFKFMDRTSIVYLHYVGVERRARFYWGTGPEFHYIYDKRTYYGTDYEITDKHKTWSIGIIGIIGMQVSATDYLCFHAEYRSSFSYSRNYFSGRLMLEKYQLNIGDGVRFGLDLYF